MLLHCTPVCSCHDEEKEVEKIEAEKMSKIKELNNNYESTRNKKIQEIKEELRGAKIG